MARWTRTVLMLSAALHLSACARDAAVLGEVEGRVRLDGRLLPGVVVLFIPDREHGASAPLLSSATTDAAGRYVLQCGDGRAGAVAGWHRVVVVDPWRDPRERAQENPRDPHQAPSALRPTARHAVVPERYSLATTTPLLVEVNPRPQTHDLDLVP
jgi:hypothetical protein